MKLKVISVLTGTLLLAACSSDKDNANKMAEGNAIPGSIEDFNRNVNNKAYFALDKSHLESDAQNNMSSVANWTRTYNKNNVNVQGNCDERGTREYNLALGQRRANAAANYLKGQNQNLNINTVSYGKDRLPAGPGNHDQNRVAIADIQ